MPLYHAEARAEVHPQALTSLIDSASQPLYLELPPQRLKHPIPDQPGHNRNRKIRPRNDVPQRKPKRLPRPIPPAELPHQQVRIKQKNNK
jgi:hypothetical protein